MQPNQSPVPARPVQSERESRQEKRLAIAVPIKVLLDAEGTKFCKCCTYEISMTGARLMAVAGITDVGQTIWMQRLAKRAKYRVIWIGKPKTPQSGQIGVELLDAENAIWESELRMRIMQLA
jgi:hypothetical protein